MTRRLTHTWLLAAFWASAVTGSAFAAESIEIFPGVSDDTPNAGDTIVVSVVGTLPVDGDAWTSTGLFLADAGGNPVVSSAVCVNQPEPNRTAPPAEQYFEDIDFTIPVDLPGGTYNVWAAGYDEGEACDGSPFDGVSQDSFEITVTAVSDLTLQATSTPPATFVAGAPAALNVAFTLSQAGAVGEGATVDFTGSTLPNGVEIVSVLGPDVLGFASGVADIDVLGAGASTSFTVTLVVASNAADGDVISLVGVAASDSAPDINPDDNTVTVPNVEVVREYDLALAAVDNPDPVLAGSGDANLSHSFTLSRSGPSDASGVTVAITASLPSGVTIVGSGATVGDFDGSTWTIPDINVEAADNGTVGTLDIVLTVDATASACTDCVSATGTVAATDGGTDTDSTNDTAVDPTSIEVASDQTVGFATSIAFSNGNTGTVTATLTCNAGLPLSQEFDISESAGVTFTMTELPYTTDGTMCEIAIDGVESGYMVSADANGTVDDSCMFDVSNFAADGANTCVFTATPMPSAFDVEIDFMGVDDPSIEQDWVLDIVCSPASEDTGSTFGTVTFNASGTGSAEVALPFFADPANDTDCTATLSGLASAIEQDGPCSVEDIAVGDTTSGECTITATVFFEGIPTLSQYGMAIMALLMLGIGFVGFRRFV